MPAGSQPSCPASPESELPSLATDLHTRFADALSAGALLPIRTQLFEVPDGDVRFAVRVVRGADRKRAPVPSAPVSPAAPDAKPGSGNPFLPYEEALYVGDVGRDHVCLLNKFPVIRNHALIVTRAFEEQEAPLAKRDFEALWTALTEIGGIGFYNAGEIAGASQRHRHLQIVPTPIHRGPRETPIEPLLDDARFDTAVGTAAGLPFLHALARLRSCQQQAPPAAATALHGLYRTMSRAFGCDRPGRPYNLLVTREWMLFVPRTRQTWEGISLNALAFAGAILVRDAGKLDRLRAVGPMALLRHAGVPTVP